MESGDKKLQFLRSFMETNGISKIDLARVMGVSAQNIFVYFKRDDMKLSYAQEIFDKFGYNLTFSLEKEQQSTQGVIIDILRVAFALYDIKRTTVAEDLGLNITGVNRWFRVDDMSISYIFKIAELYGLKVRITATPKKEATQLA